MARVSQDNFDLFVASATDLSTKSHQDLMQRCWFSLSKNKRTEAIEHRSQDSFVKITGDVRYGIATIFDQDMLIFLISQLMHSMNNNEKHGRRWRFSGYEYYKFIGRKNIGGKSYQDIWASLQRLHHTFVETDIRKNEGSQNHSFNWLSDIKQAVDANGRHCGYEVILANWIYESVASKKMVLTLDDDYFSIKGGLERWLYLFARKSAGHQQSGWSESVSSIYKKSGSLGSRGEFNRKINKIIEKDDLVGYQISSVTTLGKSNKRGTYKKDKALVFHNRDLIGAPVRDNQLTNGAKKYRRNLK